MDKEKSSKPKKPGETGGAYKEKRARPPKARRVRPEAKDLVGSMVFAIPFLAVAAGNLRNAAAISAALFTILIPVVLLQFLLHERLGVNRWISVPMCTIVALMMASLSYYIIRYVSMEITDALGSYLYLLAAYPVWAAPASEKGVVSMPSALSWSFIYGLRFGFLALCMGLIRELLAYGQVWGFSLGYTFRVEGAKMTFFGLMLMGMLLAAVNGVRILAASKSKTPGK